MSDHFQANTTDIRSQLREAVAHFEHFLPGQAPIRDFVHHNTLHGFQHLHFRQAVAEAEKLTGARGYLPLEQFRQLYQQGRVEPEELLQVIDADPDLNAGEPLAELTDGVLARRDIYLQALLHPLTPLTYNQLAWQLEEMKAFESFQDDIPTGSRQRLLSANGTEKQRIAELWNACLEVLDLTHFILHPEDLTDLSAEQAEQMLAQLGHDDKRQDSSSLMDRLIRKESQHQLDQLLARVGDEITLRSLLQTLTGHDILHDLRPALLRHLGNYLDQGLASWHANDPEQGFYSLWRNHAIHDLTALFGEFPDWEFHIESLPDDPLETVIAELRRLGLKQQKWAPYLNRLALELPGWSGMFLWRHLHPGYQGLAPGQVGMMDYLAVRLVLEHLFAHRLCAETWQIEASLDTLRQHFRHNVAEFQVRHNLFNSRLPEYLADQGQALIQCGLDNPPDDESWWQLAHRIWTWRQSPAADRASGHTVLSSAWPLFRLSQHLGLTGDELRNFGKEQIETLFDCLHRLNVEHASWLWLQAYENHYRDQVFSALSQNHGRQPAQLAPPSAQLVYCMDDREEGFRRHLEEIDPTVETFGVAAHFSVFNFWRGLGDKEVTVLCPVVAVPAHEMREQPLPGQEQAADERARQRAGRSRIAQLLHQETRRNLLQGLPLTLLTAPLALLSLASKVLSPLLNQRLSERLRDHFEPSVATRVALTAEDDGSTPTPEQPRLGYTDNEQADRVEAMLRNMGLIDNFAPLVVIMAHGSGSHNNPHLAAYNCGACSGRHSGPNGRIFAMICNRPEIRAMLAERGISIPDGAWFLGAEHNTCSEDVEWYDTDLLPQSLQAGYDQLLKSLAEAGRRHAHERCRRLASAPKTPDLDRSLAHIQGRAVDFSQARPELGHATNAAAVIGRRAMTRGAFFDRRLFLISYDPDTDPDGVVLERLLLANGPVGAGINLEYYFSTVDNEGWGCGSKITHNVTGLFGVMQGANSDLRTGLPKQMIEIHEAMRLQVVVESTIEMVTKIYQRQPPLQELIGNGWLLVSVMDPTSGQISVFDPSSGFTPWQDGETPLPQVMRSADWYSGHSGPIGPAFIGG